MTIVLKGMMKGQIYLPLVSTAIGTVSGQVSLNGISAFGGAGTILLMTTGSTINYSASVDNAGNYSLTNVANGTYTCSYEARMGYCLGLVETGSYACVVNSNTVTQNFTGTQANFYDTFVSYSNSADLRTNGFLNTRSKVTASAATNWSSITDQAGGWSIPASISLDLTGGPSGGPCMRYDWPDRTNFTLSAIYKAMLFTVSAQTATHIADGVQVTGGTSAASGTFVRDELHSNVVAIRTITGTFQSGEVVSDGSGHTATLSNAGTSIAICKVSSPGASQRNVPWPDQSSACQITGSDCSPTIESQGSNFYSYVFSDTAGGNGNANETMFALRTTSGGSTLISINTAGTTGILTGHIQYNIGARFRLYDNNSATTQLSASDMWFAFDEYMSTPWVNGDNSGGNNLYDFFEYKFSQIGIGGGLNELLLQGGHGASPSALALDMLLADIGQSKESTATLNTFGVWRRWVMHYQGVGTSTLIGTLYLNGRVFKTLTMTGCTWNNPAYMTIWALGSNINSGPSQAGQYRKWSSVQVSTTRPRLVPDETPS